MKQGLSFVPRGDDPHEEKMTLLWLLKTLFGTLNLHITGAEVAALS